MAEIIVEFPSPLTEREKKLIYGYKGEIVRCKDCWKRGDEDFCPLVHDNCYPPTLPDDWFCADGKRREE